MLAYLQDQAALLLIQFTESGEPFIPDTGSVTWSLRDHSGVLVPAYTNVALSTGATDIQKNITIPALQNTIDAARAFEKRTVVVSALRSGNPWTKVITYRVIPWLNMSVTADSARALLGLEPYELTDEEIDIYAAYQKISSQVGQEALQNALTSGTDTELKTNKAIAAQALLDAFAVLQTRLLKRRTDGSIQAERLAINFEDMKAQLQGYVFEATLAIQGESGASVMAFSFSLPVDPITGT